MCDNSPNPKWTIIQKWWHLTLGWVIFWLFPRRRVSVSLNWLPTWNNQHFYSPDPVDSSTCHFTLSGKNLMVSWSQLLLTAVRFWHLHLLLQVYRWKFKAIWKMVLSYKGDPAMEVPGKFPHINMDLWKPFIFIWNAENIPGSRWGSWWRSSQWQGSAPQSLLPTAIISVKFNSK